MEGGVSRQCSSKKSNLSRKQDMTSSKDIDTIINFLAAQMDGEQVPPTGSAAFNKISVAVGTLQKSSDTDLQVLALRTIGAVIAKVQSSITAEQALREFIHPGGKF